jgi:hypothetical protein
MSSADLSWRERQSDSYFIESVWTCVTKNAVLRAAIADPCISITLVKEKLSTYITVAGPRTSPRSIPLAAGSTCMTIRLKTGVCIKSIPTHKLTDTFFTIQVDPQSRFQLGEAYLHTPDFDHAESFIDLLNELGILEYSVAGNHVSHASSRTRARQTKRATGLSPYQLYQLQRIHQALRLLKQGMPAVQVATELAFVDQPHLVRASKQFFGRTPRDLFSLPQTP